jgi:hypothetical protein
MDVFDKDRKRFGIPPWDTPVGVVDTGGIAAGFWMHFPSKVRQQIIDEHGLKAYADIEIALERLLRDMIENGAMLIRQRWLTPRYRSAIEGRGTPHARGVRSWWECRFSHVQPPTLLGRLYWLRGNLCPLYPPAGLG